MYSRTKTWLKLNGKNAEKCFLNLIHKQGRLNRSDILPLKWYIWKNKMKESKASKESKVTSLKQSNCKIQYCWLSFILVESFSFSQEFKISFWIHFKTVSRKKIPKNPENAENTLTATKIGYLVNLGYFRISVAPSNHKLICYFIYYFLLTNCRSKNNTIFQVYTCDKVKL